MSSEDSTLTKILRLLPQPKKKGMLNLNQFTSAEESVLWRGRKQQGN